MVWLRDGRRGRRKRGLSRRGRGSVDDDGSESEHEHEQDVFERRELEAGCKL